jgi:hypothetical protein
MEYRTNGSSARIVGSVSGLTRNNTPDAALRVFHIALTAGDISARSPTRSWLIARLSGSKRSKKVAAWRLDITRVCKSVTGNCHG